MATLDLQALQDRIEIEEVMYRYAEMVDRRDWKLMDRVFALEATIDYLINTYGANGTNEVWIAPSATVYSYLLVRDKSIVTHVEGPQITPTPSQTPTSVPSNTPTPATTVSATPSPTHPPSTETPEMPLEKDHLNFLPLITSS